MNAAQILTPSTPPVLAPAPRLSEKAFQAAVIELAQYCGWEVYHAFDSRRSAAGFPDLCLARKRPHGRGKVIFAELKSERGRVRPEQMRWLLTLSSCEGVTAYLWRPSDWPAIEQVLR